jgi:hypothetical protein
MLQYLTPDIMMALLKVSQGLEVHIVGKLSWQVVVILRD